MFSVLFEHERPFLKNIPDNLVEWTKCRIFAHKYDVMTLEIKDGELKGAFTGLSFIVRGGELRVLSGRSQGGCTELLLAVMGVVALDGGYISVDGEVVGERSAAYMRRLMGYVPRELHLPDGSEKSLTPSELHTKLLNDVAAARKAIVLVDGICDEDQLSVCRKMAADGAAVLVVNDREDE